MIRKGVKYVLAVLAVLALAGVGPLRPWGGLFLGALVLVHLGSLLAGRSETGATPRCRTALAWLRDRPFPVVLAAIAIVGLAARLVGIGGELGHTPLDEDEERFTLSVLHFFETGDIQYDTVEHYPGLHFWYLAGVFFLLFLARLVGGLASMPVDVYVLAARVASALLGVATIVVVGLLGRGLARPAAGLLAAGLVALSPLAITVTTQARNDATQGLLVVGTVAVSLGLWRLGLERRALAAGVLAGVATAIKYSSVFLLLPAVGLVFAQRRSAGEPGGQAAARQPAGTRDRRGAEAREPSDPSDPHAGDREGGEAPEIADNERPAGVGRARAIGLCLLGFVLAVGVTNHFVWLDVPHFMLQLRAQIAYTEAQHWTASDNAPGFYAQVLAGQGIGWPLLLCAAGFAAWGLASGRARLWVFLSFPLAYWWFMTRQPAQFPRWVYPLLPLAAVAAGAGLFEALEGVRRRVVDGRRRWQARWPYAVATLVVLLLLPWGMRSAVLISGRMGATTATVAESWLRDNIPADARLLAPERWLRLDGTRFTVERVPTLRPLINGYQVRLGRYDYVLVPEPWAGLEGLSAMQLVERFVPDRSLGGNIGYDYFVYRAPVVPPLEKALELRVGEPEAGRYLGPEWGRPAGVEGVAVPRGGTIYLPPIAIPGARLELEIEVPKGVEGEWTPARRPMAQPLYVEIGGEPIALSVERAGPAVEPPTSAVEQDAPAAAGSAAPVTGAAPPTSQVPPTAARVSPSLAQAIGQAAADRFVLRSAPLDGVIATDEVVELLLAPHEGLDVRLLRVAVR